MTTEFKRVKVLRLTSNQELEIMNGNTNHLAKKFYPIGTIIYNPAFSQSIQYCQGTVAQDLTNQKWIPQFIYFFSGDKIIRGKTQIIFNSETNEIDITEGYSNYSEYMKLIATDNPMYNEVYGIPKPSKAFKQKYCNEQGIDNVLVEYFNGNPVIKNNEIIIRKLKDIFSRDEIEQVLENYNEFVAKAIGLNLNEVDSTLIEKYMSWML